MRQRVEDRGTAIHVAERASDGCANSVDARVGSEFGCNAGGCAGRCRRPRRARRRTASATLAAVGDAQACRTDRVR
jgi:hypothetical protein